MPENEKNDQPKIIVDDDWKKQAQAEKEHLDEQVKAEAEQPAAEGEQGPRELPPASFTTLVTSLATQALFAMGGFEDPQTKQRMVDLRLAKYHIDTLAVLEEKTKGNVTDEEKKLLDQAIYQVRMQYVEVAQRASQL